MCHQAIWAIPRGYDGDWQGNYAAEPLVDRKPIETCLKNKDNCTNMNNRDALTFHQLSLSISQ
jgi:hypothetical protein